MGINIDELNITKRIENKITQNTVVILIYLDGILIVISLSTISRRNLTTRIKF